MKTNNLALYRSIALVAAIVVGVVILARHKQSIPVPAPTLIAPVTTDTNTTVSPTSTSTSSSDANMPKMQSGPQIETGQIAEGPIAVGGRASSGVMVAALQIALKNDGYYMGPIDAKYNQSVVAAVSAYQKAHHLTVTGAVDSATLASLEKTHPKK